MAYERGQVLRALLFSLRLYIDFAASKKIKGSWDFPSLLCELISERHNVWSATMVKFSDLRILATTVIYDHFQSFLSEKPVPNGKEDIVRITPCQVNANSTQDEIFLPLSLLQSTCVLLSIWKESSDENKDDKSKGVIGFLADLLMLPSVEEMDELDVDGMDGVASATMVATEKRAVAVEQVSTLNLSGCGILLLACFLLSILFL